MKRMLAMVFAGSLLVAPVMAKSKGQKAIPAYVLQAHTVAVVIDSTAEIDPEFPRANQMAQRDVEVALMKWGRFQPVAATEQADLIIVVRKGHERSADTTVDDSRLNNRGAVTNSANAGIGLGGQRGLQPNQAGDPGEGTQPPHTQMDMRDADDVFTVFDGKTAKPLDGVPVWKSREREGLRSHDVPAVEEFRKAMAAADKAAAEKKPQ